MDRCRFAHTSGYKGCTLEETPAQLRKLTHGIDRCALYLSLGIAITVGVMETHRTGCCSYILEVTDETNPKQSDIFILPFPCM